MASWYGLLDPTTPGGMQGAGLFSGLGALGAGLMQAGQMRPVGQPGPTIADAFNAFGQGRQSGLMNEIKQREVSRMMSQEEAWRDASSGSPQTPAGQALWSSVPETRRASIFALGPQMGSEALKGLITQRPVAASPGQTLVGPDGTQQRLSYTPEDFAFRQAGRSVQSVNVDQGPQVGTIPPGFELRKVNGAYQMAAIPGGPADIKAQDIKEKKTQEATQTATQGNLVLQDIDRALSLADQSVLPSAGLGAATMAKVPGTAASDVSKLLDSVRANISFQTLTDMRKASPTGGALGAVSDRELQLLQAAKGSLDQSQSPQQFRDNLARLKNLFLDTVHGPGQGPPRMPLSFQQPAPGGRGTIEPPQTGAGGATMRYNPTTRRLEPVAR